MVLRNLMKRLCAAILLICLSWPTARAELAYTKYSSTFFSTFDTVITIIAYAQSEEVFKEEATKAEALFTQYHRLFDKYHPYEGIHNLYYINENASKAPVQTDKVLFELILYCKEMQTKLHNTVDIAMGSVLELWHDARDRAELNPEEASIPPMDALKEAAKHMDADNIVLDQAAMTVYFKDPDLKIDLGAVAKGYATELVGREMLKGQTPSFVINAGGNIRTGLPPRDGRKHWGISIQDPDGAILSDANSDIMETLFVDSLSVVTSGDYERCFFVDGVRYHHLISPQTLMPPNYMRSVTILCEDSGLADLLSTAVFLLPYEEGLKLVESFPKVDAIWIFADRSMKMTPGAQKHAKSFGAGSNIE